MAENAKKQRKPWYQSKTLVGVGVAVAAFLAERYLKLEVDEGTKAQVVDLLTGGGFTLGAVLAVWGRLTAKKSITLT